jgi:hypothetical protein
MTMTWTETEHPRAATGTFTDKTQSAPEAPLRAPAQFVRSASGVHRYNAVHPEMALAEHLILTGEEGELVDLPDTIAMSQDERAAVEFGYAGEGLSGDFDAGDDADVPLARVSITVNDDEVFSYRTRVPAHADPLRFARRVGEIHDAVSTKIAYGEDPAEVAQTFADALVDLPDPQITPPRTAAEAAELFYERGERGLIHGFYVVNRRTAERAGPYATRRIAELHCDAEWSEQEVLTGPVFLTDGTVAVMRTQPAPV